MTDKEWDNNGNKNFADSGDTHILIRLESLQMLCRVKSFEKCNMTPLQVITKSSISYFIYASKDSFQSNNEDIYPFVFARSSYFCQ